MNILITGGTGFIGGHLVRSFTDDGHLVTILSRSERKSDNRNVSFRKWNGSEIPRGIGLYDVLINLAGASIAGPRWTDSRKKLILDSRIQATKACVDYINACQTPPQIFLSASAVGIYGGTRQELLDESEPAGTDFPAEVCAAWEKAAIGANCRTINLRIGIVLGKGGGALQQMLPVYKTYLGGRFASGKQGFPWIHIDDIVGIIRFCIQTEALSGPVNLAGPEPVDQATFSSRLAKSLGKVDPFVVPEFMLRLIFGEQAILFTGGQKVSIQKIEEAGYTFAYAQLDDALKNLV